jgi:hypothetical protein
MRGVYHDVNEKHLPSERLAALAKSLPMRDAANKGRRELALAAVGLGAALLAGLPIALAIAGSAWQPRIRSPQPVAQREREPELIPAVGNKT